MSEWGFVNAPTNTDDEDGDEYDDDEDFESDPAIAAAASSNSNKKQQGNSSNGPASYNSNKPPINKNIQLSSLPSPATSAPSPRVATKFPSIGGNKLPSIN